MAQDAEIDDFTNRLRQLRAAAGDPPFRVMNRRADQIAVPGGPEAPAVPTINKWMMGRSKPEKWEPFKLLLQATIELAKPRTPRPDPADLYSLRRWKVVYTEAREKAAEPVTEPVYQGLAAFGRSDADRFYGRDSEITALVKVLDTTAVSNSGIVAVVGPSGAGKSSLLHAGLLPALEKQGLGEVPGSQCWPTLVITPGPHPLAAISREIPGLSGVSNTAAERSRAAVTSYAASKAGEGARLVLIVDQFEEIFTLADEADRGKFVDLLQAISEPGAAGIAPAVVVLGMRADFSHECFRYPPLIDALQHRQRLLRAMTIPEMSAAIERPAAKVGVKVEQELVKLLLEDAGLVDANGAPTGNPDAGVLPLVSHALRNTWNQRRGQRGAVTAQAYRDVGRLHGAVQQTADGAWKELTEQQQKAGLWLLLNLVHIGDEPSRDTRNPREWRELLDNAPNPDATEQARDVLVRERLLTADTDTVQITHEALLRSWPLLSEAIDRHRDGLAWRQKVEEAAATWERSENPHWWGRIGDRRDPEHLWRSAQLAGAREWRAKATDLEVPSDLGERFLRRSALKRVGRQALVGGVIGLLIVALMVTQNEKTTAKTAQTNQTFTLIESQAVVAQASDPSLAAQLDLVAHRLRPDDLAVAGRLISDLHSPHAQVVPGPHGAVYYVAYSPNGGVIATASDDGTVQLRDATNPQRPLLSDFKADPDWLTTASFSPNRPILATAGKRDGIRLWDTRDPRHPLPLGSPTPVGHGEIAQFAWSPDGTQIVTGNHDHTLSTLNVADPTRVTSSVIRLPGGPPKLDAIRAVIFNRAGTLVAAGGDDGLAVLLRPSGPGLSVLDSVAAHEAKIQALAFSPDGAQLATGSYDNSAKLWSTGGGHLTQLGVLTGHTDAIWSMSFPDPTTLVTASKDGSARVWNVGDPSAPATVSQLPTATGGLLAIAVAPDGRTLVAGGQDGSTLLWPLPSTILADNISGRATLALSPNRRWLATGAGPGTVRLWDLHDPSHPVKTGPPDVGKTETTLVASAFSNDGHTLATQGGGNPLRLWDVTDGGRIALRASIPLHTEYSAALAITPDGRYVIASNTDTTLGVWDIHNLAQPTLVDTPPSGHQAFITTAVFSHDGRFLVTSSSDGTCRLWDTHNPKKITLMPQVLDPHAGQIYAAALSPDDRTLAASTTADHTIRLWDLSDPTQPHELASLSSPSARTPTLAWSPDGTQLAAGGADNLVRIWRDPTKPGVTSEPLLGHTGTVNKVLWADDSTLISGADPTVLIWNVDLAAAQARLCDTTASALTPEVWAKEIPGLDYDPPCSAGTHPPGVQVSSPTTN